MSISYFIARTNYIFYGMIIDFLIVLDQHIPLDFYCAISLKQQSVDRNVPPLWHINLITRQLVFALCFQRSNKYQFKSLDLTRLMLMNHDLSLSRWACKPFCLCCILSSCIDFQCYRMHINLVNIWGRGLHSQTNMIYFFAVVWSSYIMWWQTYTASNIKLCRETLWQVVNFLYCCVLCI